MARRKTVFYGHSLDEKFRIALGFPEHERAGEILKVIDYETPKINWSEIEAELDHDIPDYSRKEIDFSFEAELGAVVRNAVASELSGEIRGDEVSEAAFLRMANRIESLAKQLAAEVDEIAEIGSQLLVRPISKDGLTSAETPDQFYSAVTGRTNDATEECFFDYYSFRKSLDYFSQFSRQNGHFQTVLGSRFDRIPDYSWYETFVRRVVLAFWPTNFPMTVTRGGPKFLTSL